jgi:hypothetical protein
VERLTFVPVPPSKTAEHPDYDDRLIRALTAGCVGFDSDVRLLRRLSSTGSDQNAGARLTPEALHSLLALDSVELASKPIREAFVLFDDVITSGKSFKCCERRLRELVRRAYRSLGCLWRVAFSPIPSLIFQLLADHEARAHVLERADVNLDSLTHDSPRGRRTSAMERFHAIRLDSKEFHENRTQ